MSDVPDKSLEERAVMAARELSEFYTGADLSSFESFVVKNGANRYEAFLWLRGQTIWNYYADQIVPNIIDYSLKYVLRNY